MFNKISNIFSTFFKRMMYCFGLIVVFISLLGSIMNTDSASKYLSTEQIFTFLAYACLFSISFSIADFIKSNAVIRRCVQFILSYASLAVVFFAGGSFSNYVEKNHVQNPAFSILAVSFMFVLIYIAVSLVYFISKAIVSALNRNKKEYYSMFDEQKSE